jgi:hypothetical protein
MLAEWQSRWQEVKETEKAGVEAKVGAKIEGSGG